MNAYSKVCQLDRYVVFLGFPADVIGGGGSGVGIETSEWTETGVPKSLDEVVAGKLRIDFGKKEGDNCIYSSIIPLHDNPSSQLRFHFPSFLF